MGRLKALDEGSRPKSITTAAADRLHNTPAICHKSYVHPAVVDLVDDQTAQRRFQASIDTASAVADLRQSETRLIDYLSSTA
ncbi:MAG: hypothetical protein AAF213_02350 [Pseudomonadota bacterium]